MATASEPTKDILPHQPLQVKFEAKSLWTDPLTHGNREYYSRTCTPTRSRCSVPHIRWLAEISSSREAHTYDASRGLAKYRTRGCGDGSHARADLWLRTRGAGGEGREGWLRARTRLREPHTRGWVRVPREGLVYARIVGMAPTRGTKKSPSRERGARVTRAT